MLCEKKEDTAKRRSEKEFDLELHRHRKERRRRALLSPSHAFPPPPSNFQIVVPKELLPLLPHVFVLQPSVASVAYKDNTLSSFKYKKHSSQNRAY